MEISKLARLARLELSADEQSRFAEEISALLSYVAKLREVKDIADEIMPEAGKGFLREDMVIGCSLEEQRALIEQSPAHHDNLIKSRPVF